MNAAADGQLAAKSNNPFAAAGTDTGGTTPDQAAQAAAMDEGDIEAEGIESALVSLERVTALLTINATQGISPGMKVTTLLPQASLLMAFGLTRAFVAVALCYRRTRVLQQLFCGHLLCTIASTVDLLLLFLH